MNVDAIIEQIKTMCPWVSRDQILSRLEIEKQKTGGLISDDTLMSMIAAEFGCTAKNDGHMPSLLVKDLFPGLNDITVTGRVLAIFPSKSFDGAKKGKLASLLICDKSDILRVVLWNDKTEMLEKGELKIGQLVTFAHGYTRQDFSGKVELHVGERSKVEIHPRDIQSHEYPDIRKFSVKIGQVPAMSGSKRVSLVGIVKKIFPATTFERKDLSQGKVMRLVLEDETATIAVVVWNEKAGELEENLRIGDRIQIVNGKIKKAMGEQLEINVDAGTYLGSAPESEEFCEITELREGIGIVNVKGEVATKPFVKEVKTSKAEIVKLATFELKDGTGEILVSAWRKHAEVASSLKQGEKVIIKNVYVKRAFSGERLEISTRNNTSIIAID
jgi:ssDNA-binding replication factor A large subunit